MDPDAVFASVSSWVSFCSWELSDKAMGRKFQQMVALLCCGLTFWFLHQEDTGPYASN